jgi:SM-20-related protein
MSTPFSCINIDSLKAARTGREPYNFLVGDNFIQPSAVDPLKTDYQALKEPGFFTEADVGPLSHGAFAKLLEDLKSPEVSKIVSEKLDIDLVNKPKMITIRKVSQAKDGRIHTDGEAKIATMLTYLNDKWDGTGAGCLRVLRNSKDFEDYVEQISPLTGAVFAFRRSDSSWHGHTPFVGERRVVQMTWLRSEEDVARKEKRGALSHTLKKIFHFG